MHKQNNQRRKQIHRHSELLLNQKNNELIQQQCLTGGFLCCVKDGFFVKVNDRQ